jgi:hypothetical protein
MIFGEFSHVDESSGAQVQAEFQRSGPRCPAQALLAIADLGQRGFQRLGTVVHPIGSIREPAAFGVEMVNAAMIGVVPGPAMRSPGGTSRKSPASSRIRSLVRLSSA